MYRGLYSVGINIRSIEYYSWVIIFIRCVNYREFGPKVQTPSPVFLPPSEFSVDSDWQCDLSTLLN